MVVATSGISSGPYSLKSRFDSQCYPFLQLRVGLCRWKRCIHGSSTEQQPQPRRVRRRQDILPFVARRRRDRRLQRARRLQPRQTVVVSRTRLLALKLTYQPFLFISQLYLVYSLNICMFYSLKSAERWLQTHVAPSNGRAKNTTKYSSTTFPMMH